MTIWLLAARPASDDDCDSLDATMITTKTTMEVDSYCYFLFDCLPWSYCGCLRCCRCDSSDWHDCTDFFGECPALTAEWHYLQALSLQVSLAMWPIVDSFSAERRSIHRWCSSMLQRWRWSFGFWMFNDFLRLAKNVEVFDWLGWDRNERVDGFCFWWTISLYGGWGRELIFHDF